MLHSYDDLRSHALRAADDRTGGVDDIYFDDDSWQVRYLVAHTGFALFGRHSLIGADLLGQPDSEAREIPVRLTREEIEAAEPPGADAPVSERMSRAAAARDIGTWPPFLIGMGVPYTPALAQEQLGLARAVQPPGTEGAAGAGHAAEAEIAAGDPHLRSMAEVLGYRIDATDGEIGSVSDFLIDTEGWHVEHVVVDTGTWLPGRRVAIAVSRIASVDWGGQRLHVDLDMNGIENAPPLQEIADLEESGPRAAMARYGTLGYWPI